MCHKRAYTGCVIVCCLLISLFFFSCKKKAETSSSRQYGTATFIIDWKHIGVESIEQHTLCYCFYPLNNGPMIQTESNTGTLKMALPPGKFGLLVYNDNNRSIKLRHRNQLDRAEAYFADKEEDDAPLSSLYGATYHDLVIVADQHKTITLTPTYFTKRVLFEIEVDEKDRDKIKECKGLLSGVAPVLHVSDRAVNRENTVEVPLYLQKKAGKFEGQLFLWDGSEDANRKVSHELILSFTLSDGQTLTSRLDIGSAFFNITQQNIRLKATASIDAESAEAQVLLRCDSIMPDTTCD